MALALSVESDSLTKVQAKSEHTALLTAAKDISEQFAGVARMTKRTLRDQIASLPRYLSDELGMDRSPTGDWIKCDAVLALLDAHTAEQPAPDAVAEADAFDAFAQWFRTNYPGPDTIIHKPDWHSQRIFRAVKHALAKGHQP